MIAKGKTPILPPVPPPPVPGTLYPQCTSLLSEQATFLSVTDKFVWKNV